MTNEVMCLTKRSVCYIFIIILDGHLSTRKRSSPYGVCTTSNIVSM